MQDTHTVQYALLAKAVDGKKDAKLNVEHNLFNDTF